MQPDFRYVFFNTFSNELKKSLFQKALIPKPCSKILKHLKTLNPKRENLFENNRIHYFMLSQTCENVFESSNIFQVYFELPMTITNMLLFILICKCNDSWGVV
jgi:hypothetical protein